MFHSNDNLKIHYKTVDGLRVNPTLEYYNWGDIKQKVNYPGNLIDETIKVKNVLTINKISIQSEHFDSITFSVDYNFHLRNNGSWFFIRAGDDSKIKTKSLKLVPSVNTGEVSIKLLKNIKKAYDSYDLVLWYFNYHKDSWVKIGRTQLIKIWSPEG